LLALQLAALAIVSAGSAAGQSAPAFRQLMLTNAMAEHITILDPTTLEYEQFAVGPAPWGIAQTPDGRAFISTAEGVAVFDIAARALTAVVPYLTEIGSVSYGEYREGGMGIAASPDGRHVYVGVHVSGSPGWLEVLDTGSMTVTGRAQVGVRPFDVVISPDGRTVYSIDHDSFTVTVVDAGDLTTRTIDVAPLGLGGFDKPHYATVLRDGTLLLPYRGSLMLQIDPESFEQSTFPLTANSHMHGIATNPDETCAAIVGTGGAGSATGDPSLTLLDLGVRGERLFPLDRPHEMVAVDDACTTAWITGGYTYADGGWDGVTVVDLESAEAREAAIPGRPLWIAWIG
jgi:hypothetical protein